MPLLVGSRRVVLGGRSLHVAASDDFTDASGVLLQNHTPSGGGAWVKNGDATGDIIISGANRARTSSGNGICTHSAIPPTRNYEVEADLVGMTDTNSSSAGILLRFDATVFTGYMMRYTTNGDAYQIIKWVAGASTILATASVALPANARIRGVAQETSLSLYVDGTLLLNASGVDITIPGFAGVWCTGTSAASTGVHLDNWLVRW
jgi:hypothetical protein